MAHHRFYIQCISPTGEPHGIVVDGRNLDDAKANAQWVIARLRGWLRVTFGVIRVVE